MPSAPLIDPQLIASLGSLSRQQLEEVRRRCSYYLQHRSSQVAPIEDEDWLLLGILTELERRGLESNTNFRIKRASSFAGFQTQSENIRALLLRYEPQLTAVQRRALGEVCGHELARYLESWHKPPAIGRDTLLKRVGLVMVAIEWAYPHYLASGLLHVIIR